MKDKTPKDIIEENIIYLSCCREIVQKGYVLGLISMAKAIGVLTETEASAYLTRIVC